MNRVESQMAELCGLARRMDGLVPDTAALLREVADTLGQLKVENAKLRDVVEAILQCAVEIKRDKGCDACPMFNADGNFSVRDSWCRLYPTLRELGVDDG